MRCGLHWTERNYVQRMTTKEWRKILLKGDDKLVYRGHVVRLIAKVIFPGVVEVRKDISWQEDEEERT